ncbi:MAG: hypothetical protein ACREXK_14800 [Gammaproteobacteria bacterium]
MRLMILRLHRNCDDTEAICALDWRLDGRMAAARAARRDAVDASPLARWLDERNPKQARLEHKTSA